MSAIRGGTRRSPIIAIGIVVAVFAVLALPVYLTAQPGFYGRYTELEPKYVPWSESSHAEAACETCHVPPTFFARTGYRALMAGEFYASLVGADAPDVFEPPTNAACLVCHSDLRTVSPKGDLQIPHRAHVTILEMECIECHNYLVHEESPSGGHVPEMEDCLRCHDGDRAKNSCWACHTEKAAPDSHATSDWLIAHAEEAQDPGCATCHDWSGDWCVQCHETIPRSHGTDWRAVHGERVAQHRSCEACHKGDFCIRCHGIVPLLNFDPQLRLVE